MYVYSLQGNSGFAFEIGTAKRLNKRESDKEGLIGSLTWTMIYQSVKKGVFITTQPKYLSVLSSSMHRTKQPHLHYTLLSSSTLQSSTFSL